MPAPDIELALLKGLSHVAPHAHVFKLNNTHFSRDPAVVAAMNSDPLIANETSTTQGGAVGARRRPAQEGVSADHFCRC